MSDLEFNSLDFKVFCFVMYQDAKGLTGQETLNLFNQNDVFSYIRHCADALHTQGERYIVSDIDEYIAIGQKQKSFTHA